MTEVAHVSGRTGRVVQPSTSKTCMQDNTINASLLNQVDVIVNTCDNMTYLTPDSTTFYRKSEKQRDDSISIQDTLIKTYAGECSYLSRDDTCSKTHITTSLYGKASHSLQASSNAGDSMCGKDIEHTPSRAGKCKPETCVVNENAKELYSGEKHSARDNKPGFLLSIFYKAKMWMVNIKNSVSPVNFFSKHASASDINSGTVGSRGILRRVLSKMAGFIYRYTYEALLNKLLSQAKTDESKIKIVRVFRAVTIGVSATFIALSIIAAIGVALPVAIGIALGVGILSAAIGFIAGPVAKALGGLYARIIPVRAAAHTSGATANTLSGGSVTSAVATHVTVALNDPALLWQKRNTHYRIAAGIEIGMAAGSSSALYNNDYLITGVATTATAMAFCVAESRNTLDCIGEVAAANTVEGAFAGRKLASNLGINLLTDNATQYLANMPVSPLRTFEVSGAAAYGYGKTFLHVRAVDTDNFKTFRNFEDEVPDPGPDGWLRDMLISKPNTDH